MKITEGLYSIAYTKGGRVHAFIVSDEATGLTLIDTGFDASAEPILAELAAMGQVPRNIKRIVLTHAHKSHISGLAALVGTSEPIPHLTHEPDPRPIGGRLINVCAAESEIPIIQGTRKATPVGWRRPKPWNAEVQFLQVMLNLGIGSHTPVRVDQRLREGDRIGPLEVIAVPGHTPGSMALWHPELKALFTGDAVASWPSVDRGWRGFNLDDKQALRSVAKMADLSAVKYLLVGHGPPITDGAHDILKELSR